VNVWIDFNNDERYDETQTRVPHRCSLHSYIALGIYDFEISVPLRSINPIVESHRLQRETDRNFM
jgi:hypothetical protein